MSRMLWGPDDCPAGGHSLKAWGEYFGDYKIAFDDFTKFTEEMLTYCTQDVALNVRLYHHLVDHVGKGSYVWVQVRV